MHARVLFAIFVVACWSHVGPPHAAPLYWHTGFPAPTKLPQLANLEAMIRYAPCGIAGSVHVTQCCTMPVAGLFPRAAACRAVPAHLSVAVVAGAAPVEKSAQRGFGVGASAFSFFSGCCFAVGRAAHGRVELRRSAALSARAGAVALLRRGRAPLRKRCRVGFAATIAASSGGGDSDPNNEPPTTTPPSPESDDEVRLRLCETARARRVST